MVILAINIICLLKHGYAPKNEREDFLNSESLSISRKALKDSEEANRLAADANRMASDALVIARKHERWAMYAVIIAIVAASIRYPIYETYLWQIYFPQALCRHHCH